LAVVTAVAAEARAVESSADPDNADEALVDAAFAVVTAADALVDAVVAVVCAAVALVDAVLAVVCAVAADVRDVESFAEPLSALEALVDAVLAVVCAAFAVVTAEEALVDAVVAVVCAAFAVVTAEEALVDAVLAVVCAVLAVVCAAVAEARAVESSAEPVNAPCSDVVCVVPSANVNPPAPTSPAAAEPHPLPVFVRNPEVSTCRHPCPVAAASPGNLIDVVPVKLAYSAVELPP
jgi:hypothetical protein